MRHYKLLGMLLISAIIGGCSSEDTILSFNDRVDIAVRIVTQQYPSAKLYEAEGTASDGPTTDPAKINQLRVVFQNVNNTTVTITETGYGEFGPPQLISEGWGGDIVIQWPIDMDLPRANQLKEAAGYTDPYGAVTLRNPLGPTLTNPYFIFGEHRTRRFIFVDTVTGQVFQGN